MAWVTFDATKLMGGIGLTGAELVAARTVATPAGVTDKLAEILPTIIREVVGRVKACPRNTQIGPEGTIPDECLSAARARCVYELGLALPGKTILNENRIKANERAEAFLRDVARCQVAIEPPETAGTEQAAAPIAGVICAPARQAGRQNLTGL